jgi:hypothetical protein
MIAFAGRTVFFIVASGFGIVLLALAIAIWFYRREAWYHPEMHTKQGEWTDNGHSRDELRRKEGLSRDLANITSSGQYQGGNVGEGYDPRENRPEKD